MKTITIVSVLVVVVSELTGAIPNSSVGGPMALLFLFIMAMLAVGIHDAWSNGRGVLGWIVSIVCAVISGGVAMFLAGVVIMEPILPLLKLDGPLATSQHPMRYIAPVGMMLITLLGSWGALKIVNRLR